MAISDSSELKRVV